MLLANNISLISLYSLCHTRALLSITVCPLTLALQWVKWVGFEMGEMGGRPINGMLHAAKISITVQLVSKYVQVGEPLSYFCSLFPLVLGLQTLNTSYYQL